MNLADALWAARIGGTLVTAAEHDRPAGIPGAYDVQEAISEGAGSPLVGWKVGATAQAAMDLLGFSEPFYGPLYERFFHYSGDEVPIVAGHGAAIETEFVVGLGHDLAPCAEPYTQAEVEAAVAWVGPGFEIVGSRLSSGLVGAGNLLVADGGANMDFVQGPKHETWRDFDLTQHPATLFINDQEIARGHSGMLMFGNTIGAVVWLANRARIAPRGLKAGDTITTGSCTGVIPISVGDAARAEFGAMGTISARFVASH